MELTRQEKKELIEYLKYRLDIGADYSITDKEAVEEIIKSLEQRYVLDKLDEIITKQLDKSNNQVECQTLRWVLDVMSEMEE